MKLSTWAANQGISYKTAWNMYKNGLLNDISKKLPTGTIIITEKSLSNVEPKIVTYARVSSSENKNNLESQSKRLQDFCSAKGYSIYKNIKEIGSGLNDKRIMLDAILKDKSINIIVIEHKDRLARFGVSYIETLLLLDNRKIEYINISQDDTSDLMQDFVSIITSFVARLYGLRRSKRRTEKLIEELKNEQSI